jgi:restriction system-associated AAA family ATPase
VDLPPEWISTTLGEIRVDSSRVIRPSESPDELFELYSVPSYDTGTPEIIRGSEIGSNKQIVEPYTVLLCKINPRINRVWTVQGVSPYRKIASTEWISFFPIEGIQPRFLQFFMQQASFRDFLSANVSGIGGSLMRIRPSTIENYQFKIPPEQEQARIVDELDRQLERLREVRQSLNRLLENIATLKRQIIISGCRGQLVPTESSIANTEGRAFESGETLLMRILENRRANWESAQLGLMRQKDLFPSTANRRSRYEEPPPVSTIALPPIPDGWTWTNLTSIAAIRSGITKGPRRDSKQKMSSIPYLRVANVQRGYLDLSEVKRIDVTDHEEQLYRLHKGDLLFTEGGDRDKLGRGWIWEGQIIKCIHQNHIFRARLFDVDLEPKFVSWYANFVGSDYFLQHGKQTTNLASINLRNLRRFPVPLPPALEQKRIVLEVEHRLGRLASTLDLTERSLKQSEVLRHKLLKLAFEGKLVPQARGDKPSETLLKQIMSTSKTPTEKVGATKRKQQRPLPEKVHLENIDLPKEAKPRDMKLVSLEIGGDYKSLRNFKQEFRQSDSANNTLSPICLVGLNGSGKSNLIEALCEIFCYLEMVNLPYEGIPQRAKQSELQFDISYELPVKRSRTNRLIRVTKLADSLPVFREIKDGEERVIENKALQLSCLPTRIVGYSSGLNETISIPFFKTQSFYSEEVRNQALDRQRRQKALEESRTLYMDYDSNAAILLANYLLSSKRSLTIFRRYLRIDDVSSFQITIQFNYGGKRRVKLTSELNDSVERLRKCASSVSEENNGDRLTFFYKVSSKTRSLFRKHFGDAKKFFSATYKLTLLNALALTGKERRLYRREDIKEGLLERPPTIAKEDRIFNIECLRLSLTEPRKEIDYAGISDGEHQFIHVFGTVKLFHEPGCLFLLDEPETHFNPLWRKQFVQILQGISSTQHQEFAISTHSPFIVSGCRRDNVIKFERVGNSAVSSTVGFETYGSSFDFLLTKLFDLNALISETALEDLKDLLRSNSLKKLEEGSSQFGESFEKQVLFEKIEKIKSEK